jgi:dipeptidyl aminopeptidase/acylaminoacyl peptidase
VLTKRLVGRSLTTPTWGGAIDEVWTVRNGTEILQVPSQGSPSPVAAEDLDRIGTVSVLRLSRDGARVALVAGPRGGQKLYVGSVTRSGGAALGELTVITPDLRNVVDVAWSAADLLLVLTRSGASDAALHSVAIDGSVAETVTTSGLPGPPSTLAAAPKMPMLTVAENGIWRLRDPQDAWTSVQRNGNVPDSAPAYPG